MSKKQIQKLSEQGLLSIRNNKLHEAIQFYEDILRIDNANDNSMHMLSIIYGQLGDTCKAIDMVVKAIKYYGWCADYYNTLAGLQLTIGKCNESLDNIKVAIHLSPEHAGAYNNLGMIFMELGKHEEAIKAYEQSIDIKNDEPYVHFNYSLALLMIGDYKKGFKEYEWRNAGNKLFTTKQPYHYCQVEGTSLCLVHEQGFGDTIQFCRYASSLSKNTKDTVICCPKELVRLISTVNGVKAKDNMDGKWDYIMPMMSLPSLWLMSTKIIPDFKPYLSTPAGDYSHIYEKIHNDKFKIGISWGSRRERESTYEIKDDQESQLKLLPTNRSLVHYSSHKRSMHPNMYKIFSSLDNVEIYSLQKGPDADQLKECNFPIIDLGSLFTDFADTAAAIDKLDLVISIDTSVAHLAGAMGKPVFTLLPFSSEWRWGWNKETTPWYPTMRLFKQKTPDDWSGVINEIHSKLVSG